MHYLRTRLVARFVLALLSFGVFIPAAAAQARELAGSSSATKTVKTAVKKRHTVTRRYSARTARARRGRLARARAASRARQWREASEPRYKLNDLGETLSEEEGHVENFISDRPITSLASAFALGVVVGFMLRRH